MQAFEQITVPAGHIAFAEAAAKLAEAHGIDSFSMSYTPAWRDSPTEPWHRNTMGNATINFQASDGRGRPCRRLDISINAALKYIIDSHPESSN